MAKLTAAKRNKMPAKEFGEPGKRAYPMPDASHAANAKARATQQENKGLLPAAMAGQIRARADKVIKRSK
jgi:hypothetical protein